MHRPRYLWCLLLTPVVFVLVLSAAGCGGSDQDQLVRKFFQAARMGDNMTLANIATVSFDPNKDGRAESISVVSETPEQARDLKLKDLDKTLKDATTAESEFSKKMKEYQDKNGEAIKRVLEVEQKGKGKIGGKDAEVQATWRKWRDESSTYQKKASEAKNALKTERKVADLSVPDKDAATFDATEFTKEITVSAKVRTPANQVEQKTLVLTLQRVVLKDSAGKLTEGKWMITALKEGAKTS
ncbi:MAG TPA: hypothetical protein VGK32_14120 [Vicinamibacterales bacterium]|jgi:hypothetical protein